METNQDPSLDTKETVETDDRKTMFFRHLPRGEYSPGIGLQTFHAFTAFKEALLELEESLYVVNGR